MLRAIRRTLVDQYLIANVFLRTSAGAGTILFLAAVAAVVAANSGLSHAYESLMHVSVGVSIGDNALEKSFGHWVNDGLMAVFFLLVGLEIKREMVSGELSSPARAMLPAVAAVGGMVAPALIFAALNLGDDAAMRGWAIPVATDIAFSLGVLALLGARVPLALKIFLMAIAVIDDLLAILIIAVFYSEDIDAALLGYGCLVTAVMIIMNFLGVKTRLPYLLGGALLWFLMLQSGVHATLAGVITAFCVPHGEAEEGVNTPLMRLEHDLHTPVTYFIMPLFAFANAGVVLEGISIVSVLKEPLSLGIVLGLVFGKPIGICGATWLAVKTGVGRMPRGCNWGLVFAVAMLCGIGFTVSLFIGNLGFQGVHDDLLNLVKAGVLMGSTIAGLVGFFVMRHNLGHKPA